MCQKQKGLAMASGNLSKMYLIDNKRVILFLGGETQKIK
jgi:hypothetical protein